MENSIMQGLANNGFKPVDYVIFFIYLAVLIFLGFFVSRKKDGKEKSSNDYFLAGNTLTWWAVGASLCRAVHRNVRFSLRIRYRSCRLRAYGCHHPGCSR